MSSLLEFRGDQLAELLDVPGRFFLGHSQLEQLYFAGCINLGKTGLPDGLLKGLTSLTLLSFIYVPFLTLPNMSDLASLKEMIASGQPGYTHEWHMDYEESEAKFDALVSMETLYLQGNLLSRVPSLKNMQSLLFISLAFNEITTIYAGDFAGATRLASLSLSGNAIVSVAAEAFHNLQAMRFTPEAYEPKKCNGDPYTNTIGIGLWKGAGKGFYGGGQEYSYPPIGFAPNPVSCQWIGPLVNNLSCTTCLLGYETKSAADTTCVKPDFRPYRGWENSSEQASLLLQDVGGLAITPSGATNTLSLLTGRTYTIQPPPLAPVERKFVGYEQPYERIHYELDFTLGAQVEIGCGTAVVGDGTNDKNVPKSFDAHPLAMSTFSFALPAGRGNPNADPPDLGYFPYPCPRYHRFQVTEAGNVTFDTCASMMDVAVAVYKATDDLSKSEPMFYNNGSIAYNQRYNV